ncbi:MAG: succinylglutamate desuccinylase/aspartoacylase family protein [Saprospiraceae bacterium]|nr:succinylglutamate desuccinylase/aspartoacylase family protein [Saprospiraceae bacterium]
MIDNIDVKHVFEEPIIIDNESVFPGEYGLVRMNVGRLPSDTKIDIIAHIFRSKNPGPCVLLLGGVHGDEINGIEIVRRSLEEDVFANLDRGSVIAIPLLNVFGFINFSREVPDGKDVNRSFPGTSRGSLASRVANTLTKKILPYVDVALDFHTGGSSRFNFPQIRYSKVDKLAEELAIVFGTRFIIQKPVIPKSFRKTARLNKIPTLVFEGGESVRLDGHAISVGVQGLKRVFAHLEMTHHPTQNNNTKSIIIRKTSWQRAPYSGIFIWSKSSGHFVKKGEPLGVLKDAYGNKSITVSASRDGYIIGHSNASVVNQGDALFHIGYEISEV